MNRGLLHRFAVPMKGGAEYATQVVSPLHVVDASDRHGIIRQILATFDRRNLAVEIKRQNTARFLNGHRRILEVYERQAQNEASTSAAADSLAAVPKSDTND